MSKDYLENAMLSETVIYLDENQNRQAAMIIAVHTTVLVDLMIFPHGQIETSVEYLPIDFADVAKRWRRRIKQ